MDLWVCCAAMKPQTGGGGGYEGLVWGGGNLDLWVCCATVKPQTGGGGSCKGSVWGGGYGFIGVKKPKSVVVLAMLL